MTWANSNWNWWEGWNFTTRGWEQRQINQVEGMKFVSQGRRSVDYKHRFEEMKSTRRECTALLWREGSNKIEKSESESSVSMQGTRLYWQSFEERLQSDTRTGWMTGCCTAKNSRTAWVRGFRRTSWKTWCSGRSGVIPPIEKSG